MAFLALSFISAAAQPTITAKSAIVMDADTGIVLYQKDADGKRFPASTTKVMTGLLLIENTKPGELITAPLDTETVTGSSLYLVPLETLTRDDALYALMLRSANDVAHAIACKVSGSDAKFAELMNKRAKQLGCTNTHFNNPHGLNDDKHTTSARDLALITGEAMRNELFRKAACTQKWTVDRSINKQDLFLKNHNKLLAKDPQLEGVKTGYTVPAGRCFVGAKCVNGWRLISVVLASQDWQADTKALFDYSFQTFERTLAARPGILGAAPVTGGTSNTVPGRLDRGFMIIATRGGTERPEVVWHSLAAPVTEGQHVGSVRARGVDGSLIEAPIVAAASVFAPPIYSPQRGWSFWAFVGVIAGGGALVRLRLRHAR